MAEDPDAREVDALPSDATFEEKTWVQDDRLALADSQIAEEHWPDRIYLGGDQDRPWMLWWDAPRPDFPTRAYVPASPRKPSYGKHLDPENDPDKSAITELEAWLEWEAALAGDEALRSTFSIRRCTAATNRANAFRAVLQRIREGRNDG